MSITWDEAKREKTLSERGLDFARCGEVFSGPTLTFEDNRQDYGEQRFVSVGFLDGRMVLVVFTERGETTRIISMRHASGKERKLYEKEMG